MITITPPFKNSVGKAIKDFGEAPFLWTWIGEGPLPSDCPALGLPQSRIDLQERIKKLSFELRQAYIDYIGAISKDQPPDWWRTSVSEKNPYISNTFFYACCIKACLQEVEKRGGSFHYLFIIQDPCLRRSLHANLRKTAAEARLVEPKGQRLRAAVRECVELAAELSYFTATNAIKILYARYRYRLHAAKPLQPLLRSGIPLSVTHIWVDVRAYTPETGEFRNLDFEGVSAFLRSRGKTVVGLANILTSASYRKVARYIQHSDSAFLVPHAFLRMRDVAGCVWKSLMHLPRRRAFPPFAGLDMGELIFADLKKDWFKQHETQHRLLNRGVERFKRAGLQIERFIYTFENHAWERVICHALRSEYPSIKLIGYQPNGLPLLLMNYFISKTESDFIPLPDRIVANGSYCARVLSESGFAQRVTEGGGLRQTYLQPVLYGEARAATNKTAAHVLVTPSIGRYRAIELIHKSVEAFRATPDLKVIVKCHPSMSIAQLRSFFPSLEIPPNMTFTTEPLSDLFPKANVLVYNDGTFPAAEALAFGLPVVFVEAEYGLSLDSLDGFPEIRPIARTPGDIAKTVLGLLAHSDNENEVRARLGIVRQLVGQVTERTFGLFADLN